jgi:hypothetical protein
MKKYLTVVAIMFFLAGCFHGEKISTISPGSTIKEVYDVMGKQEGYRKIGDYEVYSYYNKLISGWSWDRADYHYIVKDGNVVEYGAGEIRQNQASGVVFIVPLQLHRR